MARRTPWHRSLKRPLDRRVVVSVRTGDRGSAALTRRRRPMPATRLNLRGTHSAHRAARDEGATPKGNCSGLVDREGGEGGGDRFDHDDGARVELERGVMTPG